MELRLTDRIEKIASVYNAFRDGDGAALGELLGDTHWTEAAGMPYGGEYQGFGEIAANVFGPIGQDVTDFSARPDELLPAGDDRVLALGRYRGTGRNGALDVPFAHLWTLDGDRISHFVQHVDTHRFREAIG